jgi:hypothetical protein
LSSDAENRLGFIRRWRQWLSLEDIRYALSEMEENSYTEYEYLSHIPLSTTCSCECEDANTASNTYDNAWSICGCRGEGDPCICK